MKLAVRLAILLPLDVRLFTSWTGSTLADLIAMIISEADEEEDAEVVGSDDFSCSSFEGSVISRNDENVEIESALKADGSISVGENFGQDEELELVDVEWVAVLSAQLLVPDIVSKTHGFSSVLLSAFVSLEQSSDIGVVPKAKNGGKNDPGSDA